MVSRVVAGLILWSARFSSGVICRSDVAMVPAETPNSSARTGFGTARRCRTMVTRIFSARVSACGWPPARRRVAGPRDVHVGFALGLVGEGQRGGELVPARGCHPGQAWVCPAVPAAVPGLAAGGAGCSSSRRATRGGAGEALPSARR